MVYLKYKYKITLLQAEMQKRRPKIQTKSMERKYIYTYVQTFCECRVNFFRRQGFCSSRLKIIWSLGYQSDYGKPSYLYELIPELEQFYLLCCTTSHHSAKFFVVDSPILLYVNKISLMWTNVSFFALPFSDPMQIFHHSYLNIYYWKF